MENKQTHKSRHKKKRQKIEQPECPELSCSEKINPHYRPGRYICKKCGLPFILKKDGRTENYVEPDFLIDNILKRIINLLMIPAAICFFLIIVNFLPSSGLQKNKFLFFRFFVFFIKTGFTLTVITEFIRAIKYGVIVFSSSGYTSVTYKKTSPVYFYFLLTIFGGFCVLMWVYLPI